MLFAVTRQAIRVAPAYTRTAAIATPARRAWSPASATVKKAAATPATAAVAAAAPSPSSSKVGSSTAATSSPPWEEGTDGLEAGVDDSLLPPSSQPIPSPSTSTTSTTSSAALPSAHTAFPFTPLAEASYAAPIPAPSVERDIDWSTSFHGISSQPFSEKAAALLMRPLVPAEIEIKPDGLLYLPEILYRRILNQAFGPGGWGMVPRGEMTVLKGMVSREWGLVAGGRLVSVARGEQTYFDPSGLPTATEGCKSNALMRCCKDLGIASELWDPGFTRQFKAAHCVEAWTEHGSTKKKQKRWRKKGNKFEYPLKEAV